MIIDIDNYINFVKEKFEPVSPDRAKLTTAGCMLAQQVDEIDLALQGVFEYDVIDDAGDALFAVAYIASVENIDLGRMINEAEQKQAIADISQLKNAAIGVVSACSQYANYTLRKGVPATNLFRQIECSLLVFLIQLLPFLKQEGTGIEGAIKRNIEKLS